MARRSRGRRARRSSRTYVSQVGDSLSVGREPLLLASRRPSLLPRLSATAYPVRRQPELWLRSVPVHRRVARTRAITPTAADLRRRFLKGQSFTRNLLRPRMDPALRVCVSRLDRKEVLFAKRVAGRRWNSGSGPDMRRARRSQSSNYSCKR